MATVNNLSNDPRNSTPRTMKIIFGIFMIIIYLGMGILMLTSFFDNVIPVAWIRYVLAVGFIAYGIWRGIRQFSPKLEE
ncbi:MAG: hypothetical protein K2H32_03025 [Muribaculaceae bacterium]|nr:hypothetical protein [Muribaculaceae bacterium]MDE5844925.1 hypothetical protein [Muribaculaceae bacterium]MDE5857315.1 hypothetical protein [Muribaculaceae bacterium]MDE7156086.1 hypothetical protein [Muribaculaceae bacterium]MDE7370092.1 hypothetical protein [Muribaculaceae bacterium]